MESNPPDLNFDIPRGQASKGRGRGRGGGVRGSKDISLVWYTFVSHVVRGNKGKSRHIRGLFYSIVLAR